MSPTAKRWFLVAITSCGAVAGLFALRGCAAGLPERRPSDFALSYGSSTGGMSPHPSSTGFQFSSWGSSCMENGVNVPLSPTPQQLDEIYGILRRHHFDAIETVKHPIIYDGGGSSMTVTAAGKTYQVGDSAETGIGSGREDYDAICADLGSVVPGLIDAQRVDVHLKLDPALAGKPVTLSVDSEALFVTKALDRQEASLRMLPGNHRVSLTAGDHNLELTLELEAGSSISVLGTPLRLETSPSGQ